MKSLTAILGLAMFGIVGQAGRAAEVPSTLAAGDGRVSYVFSTRGGLRLDKRGGGKRGGGQRGGKEGLAHGSFSLK